MTEQQDFILQDCVAFLSSVAESYPTGIPEELIVAPVDDGPIQFQTGAGNPDARLVFISAEANGAFQSRWPLTDASANLLEAALSRGMQMSPDEVFVFNLAVGEKEVLSTFKEEFKLVSAESYIILGEEAHRLLVRSGVTSDQVGEFNQGDWYGDMLCTHELAAVTRSQDIKREFWQDLKAVMRFLGGSQ